MHPLDDNIPDAENDASNEIGRMQYKFWTRQSVIETLTRWVSEYTADASELWEEMTGCQPEGDEIRFEELEGLLERALQTKYKALLKKHNRKDAS